MCYTSVLQNPCSVVVLGLRQMCPQVGFIANMSTQGSSIALQNYHDLPLSNQADQQKVLHLHGSSSVNCQDSVISNLEADSSPKPAYAYVSTFSPRMM